MKYRIDTGKLTVKARSNIHDTTTVWDKIAGEVDADPDTLATAGAAALFRVDMTAFDAGDWLKNRKLRKDFDLEGHPQATFELRAVRDVVRDGARFTATAEGVLRWRGKEVVLVLAGHGTLEAMRVEATATFELDIKTLGLTAPRILMFKVEDEVTVAVTISGKVAAWAVLLIVAIAACSGREPEPAGVGKWSFTRSTLAQVHDGNCQPTDLRDGRKATWCFAQTPFKVGKRSAEVDVYFLGTEPTAPLIELQLKVRGCVEDELDQWMRENFGVPTETKATRSYWSNSFLWAAALMPSEPGRCLVHFLPLSENAEIARIKAE